MPATLQKVCKALGTWRYGDMVIFKELSSGVSIIGSNARSALCGGSLGVTFLTPVT